MSGNYKSQKAQRKVTRCVAIIEQECGIKKSSTASNILAILNAGLSTGLTEEAVVNGTSPHGNIMKLVMLPNKSYCFLHCNATTDAENIYEALHNQATLGQNNAIIYLAYFEEAPVITENGWQQAPPKGLTLLKEFVTSEEEQDLLLSVGVNNNSEHINATETDVEKQLKHRRVLHFGYEFIYGVNNVDLNKPLKQNIPAACNKLWPRIKNGFTPEQLTVNEYQPGQGIPPHVDTHSAFLSPIVVLSLEADIVMEFRRRNERIPILLPQRSLLILDDESRYDWTHGITPKVMDVIPTANGSLTTKFRRKRTSLTFRRLRRGPCDCAFPTLCDTKLQQNADHKLAERAELVEMQTVHKVYEQIAAHFDETRHMPWPRVAEFLLSFVQGSVVLDVGCGNGKYLQCNKQILMLGCDRSQELLSLCGKNSSAHVFRCDCLTLPVLDESVDGVISIAVIHHLATAARRLAALREMTRVLKINGRALVYVWAKDQRANDKKSSYLLQNKALNRNKETVDQQRQKTNMPTTNLPVDLPIHTNRTDFQQQDVYVPWKLKQNLQENEVFLRYYHVFENEELENLLKEINDIRILNSYYDQGNHCVIFEKIN